MARKTDPVVTEAERAQRRADAKLMSKPETAVRHEREETGPETGSGPRVPSGKGSEGGTARPSEEPAEDVGTPAP